MNNRGKVSWPGITAFNPERWLRAECASEGSRSAAHKNKLVGIIDSQSGVQMSPRFFYFTARGDVNSLKFKTKLFALVWEAAEEFVYY
jgi:hypothetical protein